MAVTAPAHLMTVAEARAVRCAQPKGAMVARVECHHIRGRNVTPEHRYSVPHALLLCLECHGKAGRKEVKVPKP